MQKIAKLLIANRGEISLRIQKTCQRLGIRTVAVYSEADQDSIFVASADEAYCIGAPEPSQSYLNQDAILEVCKKAAVDAVHPGYGFLSENSTFARNLREQGIRLIGPSPESMELMGDKIQSREAMIKAGVPVVPGFSSDSLDANIYLAEAEKIGFPVMVKATAGGGGKGMRRVDKKEDFLPSYESAVREAEKAFGNGVVFIEKYITNPRHVEFQIMGDSYGNVIHLHERDCSIQRRHQKVLEETPAPHFPEGLKQKMGDTAILAAKSISYLGAGTVEFILGDKGEFYFLEMNTRLQVEHPVTEMVTGLDLVEMQIRIAEGESIPEPLQKDGSIPQNGHSMEVRIYAEDPNNEFLPSVGKIEWMKVPTGKGIRFDTGVDSGSEVSIYYDPMIGKLIVHAENRETCRLRLLSALRELVVFGPITNISFLIELIQEEDFSLGKVSTHFLDGREYLTKVSDYEKMGALGMVVNQINQPKSSESVWKVVGNAFSI